MTPIDFNGLDTAVHGPLRLGALSLLQIDGSVDFTTLKKRLQATDGALGMHLQKLEETGYIECKRAFVGKRPKSTYRITPAGRRALAAYLDAMQRLISAIEAAR
jgi:DNA-binding MarR family transcriptional regulator